MRLFLFFVFFLLIAAITVAANTEVIIYKSAGCGHCYLYINQLKSLLDKQGIKAIVEKDIIKDKNALQELDQFTRDRKIPYDMQGHMVTRINDLTIEGHVPLEVINDLFKKFPDRRFPSLVLFQDSMDAFVTEYKVMTPDGSTAECTTKESIEACQQKAASKKKSILNDSFFWLVAANALLAGIHPCTLSVLLLFIAFLFTMRSARSKIVKGGAAYIIGIFIAYFSIGLGILKAVSFTTSPHIAAKVGAMLILLLGVLNLLSVITQRKLSLGTPKFVKPAIASLLQRATIPAIFLVGVLVGICSFGCTAGIYLSIMGIMLAKPQYLQGVAYLILYNVMFILPLIVVLVVASNKKTIEKIKQLELSNRKRFKIIAGVIMIILALFILWTTWS